jgi:prepilin-type processing-associated H-X9-DG protein
VDRFFYSKRMKGGDSPRIMTEMSESDQWLASDWFCKPIVRQVGHGVHGGDFGSLNVLYVDGHVKYYPRQSALAFK